MNIDLMNRNITGELIAFVKKGLYSFYCMGDVEYFIGEYWNGYIDINNSNLEEEYFDYLKLFKVDYYELHFEYQNLINASDEFDLLGNTPKIYIDFGIKYFASNFQEQELERRVPEGWKGENVKIASLIPDEFRYWNPYKSDWI